MDTDIHHISRLSEKGDISKRLCEILPTLIDAIKKKSANIKELSDDFIILLCIIRQIVSKNYPDIDEPKAIYLEYFDNIIMSVDEFTINLNNIKFSQLKQYIYYYLQDLAIVVESHGYGTKFRQLSVEFV